VKTPPFLIAVKAEIFVAGFGLNFSTEVWVFLFLVFLDFFFGGCCLVGFDKFLLLNFGFVFSFLLSFLFFN
jgi:hypothetical protein